MRKLAFIITVLSMLIRSNYIYSQQNLVPNPSFEDTVACPQNGNLNNLSLWMNPTLSTPDYFNSCASGNFSVPQNAYGFQNPRTGTAYVGISSIINGSSWREYIQIQLSSPLVPGEKYCVEFYICTSDSSTYSINNLGAYFSTNSITSPSTTELNVVPQIINNTPLIQPNTWQIVADSFIASGGENYITIGNFNTNLNTDTSFLNWSSWAEGYHFIDDVKVQACSSTNIYNTNALSNKVKIFPNPTNGILYVQSESVIEKFEVRSSLGETLLISNCYEKNIQIDISKFEYGVYYTYVTTNNIIQIQKIIITN